MILELILMISSSQPEARVVHQLARFVTKEAIALLLNLNPEQIYRIDCWQYVIHVVGKGVSTFVSYADLPPILGAETPTARDFLRWRKRWRKNQYKAPGFWVKFYEQKLNTAPSLAEMYRWGELLSVIKSVLSEAQLRRLRSLYAQKKQAMENFQIQFV